MEKSIHNKIITSVIFLGFGLSGAAALIYEVAWTRSLSTIMGSSTYAVSTMLAAFMAGLSLGGWLGGMLTPKIKKLGLAFAMCELGIGLTGMLTLPLIFAATPLYMKSFYRFHLSFNTFSVVQFGIIFMIMAIPTTLMGLTFPFVVKLFSAKEKTDVGKEAGNLYGINTLGAILGSIAAGFLLIPTLGVRGATLTAATINLLTALVIFLLLKELKKAIIITGLITISLVGFVIFSKAEMPYFSYYNAYRFSDYKMADTVRKAIANPKTSEILFRHEGAEGDVALIRYQIHKDQYELSLINNGKMEAGDEKGFALLAYLPFFLYTNEYKPETALNIGLGSGHTLARLAQLPFLKKIDSVELSEGILTVNKTILRPDLFDNNRIEHIHADGRNFLLLTKNSYDFIVVSPSWAVESASAGMLTDEFFKLAKEKLTQNGVMALWIDYFMMPHEDLEVLARTFNRHFAHLLAWNIDDDFIIFTGSNTPFGRSPQLVKQMITTYKPELKDTFRLALTEEMINNLPAGEINTDNLPIVEFRNARHIITWQRGG